MNREFYRRLQILLWAAVHDDIRYCLVEPPIALKVKRRPWKKSGLLSPALEITLTFQQPRIYIPYSVRDAYDRRNWTEAQWEAHRTALEDIPF